MDKFSLEQFQSGRYGRKMNQARVGVVLAAYVMVTVLGWAAAGLGSDVEVEGREIVKSDRRTRKPVTGRQVVTEWQVPEEERTAREKISDRVKELRGELEPETDRERAFKDAVAAFESLGSDRSQNHDALIAEMSVRWLQWAEISPEAAVEGTAPLSVRVVRRLYLGLLPFCHELVEREGWRRSLELADLGHPVFTSNFPGLVNVEVSQSGSIAEAKEFLAETASRPSRMGPSYSARSLAERWDLNQRDEFLEIVEGQNRVNAAMAFFSRLEGKEATAWLLDKIDEGLFSQEQLPQLGSLSLSSLAKDLGR